MFATSTDANGAVHPPTFLSSPLPSALSSDPSAPASTHVAESGARIDAFLHAIGSMFYRNHGSLSKDSSGPAEVWVSSDYDKLEYPTLDLLLSPLRKPHVLDNWCPREIALFEAGICSVGKDFHAIARLIQTKSCKECVDFYYVWKKSSHYALWKNFGKPAKKPHANKEEQWKVRTHMAYAHWCESSRMDQGHDHDRYLTSVFRSVDLRFQAIREQMDGPPSGTVTTTSATTSAAAAAAAATGAAVKKE